jgi:hypothetical protein
VSGDIFVPACRVVCAVLVRMIVSVVSVLCSVCECLDGFTIVRPENHSILIDSHSHFLNADRHLQRDGQSAAIHETEL